MDRCGPCRATLARRGVSAAEEMERSQPSIVFSWFFNCSGSVMAMVLDPNRTLFGCRRSSFSVSGVQEVPWLVLAAEDLTMPLAVGSFKGSCCLVPPLGRIVGMEPQLSGVKRHPTC